MDCLCHVNGANGLSQGRLDGGRVGVNGTMTTAPLQQHNTIAIHTVHQSINLFLNLLAHLP